MEREEREREREREREGGGRKRERERGGGHEGEEPREPNGKKNIRGYYSHFSISEYQFKKKRNTRTCT